MRQVCQDTRMNIIALCSFGSPLRASTKRHFEHCRKCRKQWRKIAPKEFERAKYKEITKLMVICAFILKKRQEQDPFFENIGYTSWSEGLSALNKELNTEKSVRTHTRSFAWS